MNSSKIEELAITFLKEIFLGSDFIKTSFAEGDKKPLVDGNINIYWRAPAYRTALTRK